MTKALSVSEILEDFKDPLLQIVTSERLHCTTFLKSCHLFKYLFLKSEIIRLINLTTQHFKGMFRNNSLFSEK